MAEGYKEHQVESKIENVHFIERHSLSEKREYHIDNYITSITQHHLVVIYPQHQIKFKEFCASPQTCFKISDT